ncbi:MAG: ATP-binding cassette domain-containing protein [Candidatus Diapherotrites archaeon]|nr:ATP-binding cassette domain-containing protein [Candidatus Diapherotrites archaeon]
MNAVSVDKISFCYGSEKNILDDFSLDIAKGSTHIIVGQSGAGKTTLLKIMGGIIKAKKGKVTVFEKNLENKKDVERARKTIAYIPQNLGLVENSPAIQNILLGCLNRIKFTDTLTGFPEKEKTNAAEIAKSLGIEHVLNKKTGLLSGGEKRRVAIARALMQNPKILLADEFVSDLDYENVKHIMKLLEKMKKQYGLTLIIVDHHKEYVKKFSDKVTLLERKN